MRSKIQPAWQDRRSDFNHDWLKNQFIPALETAHNILQGRINAEGFMAEFLEHDLPKWEVKRIVASELVSDFKDEMTPRNFFDASPLSCAEPYECDWMKDVTHELWLAKFPVSDWISDALEAVRMVDSAYEGLSALVNEDMIAGCGSNFSQKFAEFRAACHNLAKAIEKFPNDISIT